MLVVSGVLYYFLTGLSKSTLPRTLLEPDRHMTKRATSRDSPEQQWSAFVEGTVYADAETPWRDDPAFPLLREFPGLRESVGGRIADALTQAIGLVQAISRLDLRAVVHARTPAQGLCLGFGMNVLEPYDLLQVFALDRVHAYEWVGEHVIEAAQALSSLRTDEPLLPFHLRLHHGTISDLRALADSSVRVVYVANVFTHEIPMSAETFHRALQEIRRVLDVGGVVLSRGSSGALEAGLAPHGRLLLHTPLVSVFQKEKGEASA